MERAVRLPAALRAAKQAGAGSSEHIQLVTSVDDKYIEMAEEKVITKAHSRTYIKRMKSRCMAAASTDVVALTADSDGNGGEDTSEFRISI